MLEALPPGMMVWEHMAKMQEARRIDGHGSIGLSPPPILAADCISAPGKHRDRVTSHGPAREPHRDEQPSGAFHIKGLDHGGRRDLEMRQSPLTPQTEHRECFESTIEPALPIRCDGVGMSGHRGTS